MKLMDDPSRRAFLAVAGSALAAGRALGANDRVNVAVVGLGGRGTNHIDYWSEQKNVRIAAICDVNQAAQERAAARIAKFQPDKPEAFADMRKLFASKNVDAVSIATPNHWHALATIWACQAGKDVYCEKPACHNIFEGRQMIEAARKYKRIVQVGSQSRSNAHKIRAAELLQQGVIGQIYLAKALCFKRRKSIGHTPDVPVPAGVDWSLFLGPAQMKPYSENKFKYNWHWFWDTGNGDIGNQGVHEMDYALWGLGQPGLPRSVVSTGGKYIYNDDQETPNTQLATFDYGSREIVFEVRGLMTGTEGELRRLGNNITANLFYGSEGWMAVDPDGFQVFKGENNERVMDEKKMEKESYASPPHFANFVAAVRARDPKVLHAPVEVGVMAANLCHLANISYRVGRRLTVDPMTWRFPGDEAENALLTRNYRSPFVVPENV